jgi:hypothetical protein
MIEIGPGIEFGPGILIGGTPPVSLPIATEAGLLIISESGDQIVEE